MTIYEIQGPDGKTYEVDAPDMQSAVAAFRSFTAPHQTTQQGDKNAPSGGMDINLLLEAEKRGILPADKKALLDEARNRGLVPPALPTSAQQTPAMDQSLQAALLERAKREKARRVQQSAPQTNMLEQSMSGVNEGIATTLGAPVDLATGALNLGAQGINALVGTDFQPIENPVGGSGTFRDMLAPTISDIAPQTTAQRYGRRIGQEVGATAIPGGVMARTATAPAKVIAGGMASATGAGIGGQAAREIAPESDLADLAGSMIGGGVPIATAHGMRSGPKAPTLEQLQTQSDAGYDAVRASNATLSPQSSNDLANSIEGAFGPRVATRKLNPKAAIAADALAGDMRSAPMSIADVDEARQWIGRNVAGSVEKGERAIGMGMKQTIDDHLDALTPADVTGTNRAAEVVDTLKDAREKASRVHKSQLFEAKDTGLVAKGLRRAATSGTGGNEINAIRQNVRRVLENPKLRRGYNADELQAMRDIADGTPTQNALRLLSRLAPTSGALPLGGFAGSMGATGATGNPLFMVPSGVGYAAKAMGERSTRRQVEGLGELIRNGAPLPKKGLSEVEQRMLAQLISARATSPTPDGQQGALAHLLQRQLQGINAR